MPINVPISEGIAYNSSNAEILIAGVPTIALTNVSYTVTRAVDENFGLKPNAVTVGFGQIVRTCSIEFMAEALEALQLADPGGKGELWSIPFFDIIVTHEDGINITPVAHILKNCRFKGNGRTISAGDSLLTYEVEIFVGDMNLRF